MIRIAFLFFCTFFSVDSKKVTFASYRSEKLEGNLKYLHEAWIKRDASYHFIFLFRKLDTSLVGKCKYLIHMLRATYHLATSRFFVIDDYYVPIYMLKQLRNGTEVIQLWHAAGAFKKFGYSIMNKEFGPSEEYAKIVKIHGNYSRVYVSSSEVIPFYAEAFRMKEERIFPLGLPRTDFFFLNHSYEGLRHTFNTKYPQFEDKKLILYAPTFRGSGHYQSKLDVKLNLNILHQTLGNEYALLVHLHPYMKSSLDITQEDEDFACHINGQFTIEELLVLADILVTDYSSVIFEYSLMEKPIFFYAPDLQEYISERDFYYQFEDMIPGPVYQTTGQLGMGIKKHVYYEKRMKTFKARFFDFVDGQASKRIIDHLLCETDPK